MKISSAELIGIEARLARNRSRGKPDPMPTDVAELEGELQGDIEKECIRRGWLPIRPRMDKRPTVRAGCPDFIIYRDGGRMLSVECKARKEKPTIDQLTLHVWAEKLGHKVHVVRSFQQFLDLL